MSAGLLGTMSSGNDFGVTDGKSIHHRPQERIIPDFPSSHNDLIPAQSVLLWDTSIDSIHLYLIENI